LDLGLIGPSEESTALLGIGEGLAIEDLGFPILFDESEYEDSIDGEVAPVGGAGHGRSLDRGNALRSEMMDFAKRDKRGRQPFPALRLSHG
jgi:hypothetical protein